MKKTLALFLVVVMMFAMFTACNKKEETVTEENKTIVQKSTVENEDKIVVKEEVPMLKWVTVGGGQSTNYDAWQNKINPYIEEKIGVNVDVEVVAWGNWDKRRSILVNSGEPFDILFTDAGKYVSEVNLGVFENISKMVKNSAPELYKYIPEMYWKATSVNGNIYAVPTYKDSSATNYYVWDIDVANKYNLDIFKYTTLESLTEPLQKIKEGEKTAPYRISNRGCGIITRMYDGMGIGVDPIGVRIDDVSKKVVNVYKQEDVLKKLDVIHDWYKKGIINADAPTLDDSGNYSIFGEAQGWPLAAKTVWGPGRGCEAEAVQATTTVVTNDTVRGSLNGISVSSKYKEKALELLQLVNLDTKVRDAFYFGLEGENFEYTEEHKIQKLNHEWKMAGYTQGTFFTVSQMADQTVNQWDEVKELNAKAIPSTILGFNLDTSNLETEIANSKAVFAKYKAELLCGAREPRALIEQMNQELEAAGFETILEEAQKQINAMK